MKRCLLACIALLVTASSFASELGTCFVEAARRQIGVTLHYDPAYRRLSFPNGDVPIDRGVCTDVLIRAYRVLGLDLQERIHEDMRAAWPAYPKLWQLTRPDPNIDHRRVPNLATFFSRHGEVLANTRRASDYAPGDIVTWQLSSGVPHIGIVSDRNGPTGVPLVVHNIGQGAVEEDVLFQFEITGHYRHLPRELGSACGK